MSTSVYITIGMMVRVPRRWLGHYESPEGMGSCPDAQAEGLGLVIYRDGSWCEDGSGWVFIAPEGAHDSAPTHFHYEAERMAQGMPINLLVCPKVALRKMKAFATLLAPEGEDEDSFDELYEPRMWAFTNFS